MLNKFFSVTVLSIITLFVICSCISAAIIIKSKNNWDLRTVTTDTNAEEPKEERGEEGSEPVHGVDEEDNPELIPTPTTSSMNKNEIIIGIEYAFPGTGKVFAETGMNGVKFFPENFYRWMSMQPNLDKPIDFSELDALVHEYQDAGIENITVGLRYDHDTASVDSTSFGSLNLGNDYSPKDENIPEFEAWLKEFVERYDGDGLDDMPGLRHPIRHYEFGVEYSSYTPEPGEKYVESLKIAYDAMHDVYPDVSIAHAAFFLVMDTAIAKGLDFDPEGYPQAITNDYGKLPSGNTKNYDEVKLILENHEYTDVWNIHSLGSPYEIDHLVRWLRWEESQRNIDPKPIIISDTVTSPYVGFGDGTRCNGFTASTFFYPVRDKQEHCKVAEYFEALVEEGTAQLEAFARKHTAEDIVKKAIIAASNDIVLINSAFTEDFEFLQNGFFGVDAGAGFAGWAGVIDVARNGRTQERTVKDKNPGWYSMKQMIGHIKGYNDVFFLDVDTEEIRLYKVDHPNGDFWIAWMNTQEPVLPDDSFSIELDLPGALGSVKVEKLLSDGKTKASQETMDASSITLTETPVFIFQ